MTKAQISPYQRPMAEGWSCSGRRRRSPTCWAGRLVHESLGLLKSWGTRRIQTWLLGCFNTKSWSKDDDLGVRPISIQNHAHVQVKAVPVPTLIERSAINIPCPRVWLFYGCLSVPTDVPPRPFLTGSHFIDQTKQSLETQS